MRVLLFVLCLKLAFELPMRVLGADAVQPAPSPKPTVQASSDTDRHDPLAFNGVNEQILLDALAKPPTPLAVGPIDPAIARVTALLLEQQHYLQQPLDNSYSSKFLTRYLEVLDGMHMHFLQSDIEEFDKAYRTTLDELTERLGDIKPAQRIFSRLLERVEERVDYVAKLLKTETFEFTGDDRYDLDRRKAARPRDLDEAQELWRKHLRYEILQEKLNKEKPAEIADKITRRYARMLRTLKEYDNDDVIELYLSSLAHAYDPHSDYMGKSQWDNFNISMKLSLFGIGALLRSEDDYCKIVSLTPEGPAEKSKKLKANDRIIEVAQGTNAPVDVVGWKLSKVVDLIRGPKGTVVRLTVIPADAADPSVRKIVTLVRDEIKLEEQQAKAKLIELPSENGKPLRLGVIDLPSFYADFGFSGPKVDPEAKKSTTKDVSLLLEKLKQEKVDGVILDLRRNGGGSLEEAINLTGLFIKEGPVVQVVGPDGQPIVDRDTDPSILYDGPLVVLTSRFSASASEILAGALQDYGRALIVGDSSTHGKGTVQSVIQLKNVGAFRSRPSAQDPGVLKLTIRKFYRASGSSTQLEGVIPDIILPSPNDYAEVGEKTLENALPWDQIPPSKYEKLNRIKPILAELRKRSSQRISTDKDFEYLRDDIEQMKKALADKTVSLNETQRLKEKAEAEARLKARQEELKSRPDTHEKIYDLTLKLAALPGLPPPESKTNSVAKADSDARPAAEGDETETTGAQKIPPVDAALKEVKRILADLVALSGNSPAVAANDKKPADAKVEGNVAVPGRN